MKPEPFVSLSSLESDLRGRIEGEVRELEGRRARLERDARAADEFVRRVSSMMPGPSGAAVALFPSLAGVRSGALAPEPAIAPAPAHAAAALRAPRPNALAGVAAVLAVMLSFAALFLSTGHRAEIASASAAELMPPPRPLPATTCAGVAEAPAPVGSAASSSARAPSPVPLQPLAVSRPAPAKMASGALRMRTTADAAPKVATPASPAADAGSKLEEAARTAAMLREQLSATLH